MLRPFVQSVNSQHSLRAHIDSKVFDLTLTVEVSPQSVFITDARSGIEGGVKLLTHSQELLDHKVS